MQRRPREEKKWKREAQTIDKVGDIGPCSLLACYRRYLPFRVLDNRFQLAFCRTLRDKSAIFGKTNTADAEPHGSSTAAACAQSLVGIVLAIALLPALFLDRVLPDAGLQRCCGPLLTARFNASALISVGHPTECILLAFDMSKRIAAAIYRAYREPVYIAGEAICDATGARDYCLRVNYSV